MSSHCRSKKSISNNDGRYWMLKSHISDHSHEMRVFRVFFPQILLFSIFLGYLFLGALIFPYLDDNMQNYTFPDMILFCFTTLSTIGYGNISPVTKSARLFCIGYATLGVPLSVLMLGNLGKYLAKAYWMVKVCLGRVVNHPSGEAYLPLKIILLLYFVVFMFGCLLYPPNQTTKNFTLQNLYFSVISFSTVGFGDEFLPIGSLWWHFFTMYTYLSCGMILSTMLFSDLYSKLRQVDKIGTRVRGAQDVVVWFGDKPMKVSQLLQVVAKEFDVKPGQMHSLLHGLDDLLQEAAIEVEQKSFTDTVLHSNASETT